MTIVIALKNSFLDACLFYGNAEVACDCKEKLDGGGLFAHQPLLEKITWTFEIYITFKPFYSLIAASFLRIQDT
jgi:hypothetical protein